jgi:hypothetical protein
MKISTLLLYIFILASHLGSVVHDSFVDEIAIEIEEKQTHEDKLITYLFLDFKISHLYPIVQISNVLTFNFTTISLDNEIDPPEHLIA